MHYANMYFHNAEYNNNIHQLTETVTELKREIENIKTQLERKHIIEIQPEKTIYTKFINFFWHSSGPPPPQPQS
jgi:ADP-dependent phosphofructokinase/glucokinase